ncbi:MAG: hypothetical protein ABWY51_07965, partial [Gaiellaceae bacterium]
GGTCTAPKKVVGGQFVITTAAAGDRGDLVVFESKRNATDNAWIVSIIANGNNKNVTSFVVTSICTSP